MQILKFVLGCLFSLLLVPGAFLGPVYLWMGQTEFGRATGVADAPSTTTYEQLVADQVPSNRYVVINDLAMCWDGYAWQSQGNREDQIVAYVPVYAEYGEQPPQGKDIQLIAKVFDARDEHHLNSKLTGRAVEAVLDDGHFSMPKHLWKHLEEFYPGIEIGRCRLLIVDGMIPSRSRAMVFTWIGALTTVGSGIAWVAFFVMRGRWKDLESEQEFDKVESRPLIDQTF